MNTDFQSGRTLLFLKRYGFMSLYIEHRNEDGKFIYKYPNLAPRRLFKSGAY